MAQPSSTHHERTERDRDRDRHHRSERERDRSHHHHRTISSTTLLLVLSLVLAGLAVMLSLPRQYSVEPPAEGAAPSGSSGVFGYLSPKRTQALISRERDVAQREAEVARREAELLVGAPGGVIPTPCAPCIATTVFETVSPPAHTIIKEIVKEDSLTPPGWAGGRAEEVLDRELRITERERDVSKREEGVNRREHDASRRESWIMEQLMALGNDSPEVEEEFVYDPRRKVKVQHLPPIIEAPPETKTVIQTQTQTITVPAPANTRRVASPLPQVEPTSIFVDSPRTTAVEFITEEDVDDGLKTVTVVRSPKPTRRPAWFGGW